jgi:3-deoxy-7-phosphoheptulonate synthase
MIIIMKSGIGDAEIDDICRRVTDMGYAPHIIRGEFKTIVAAVGEERGRPDLRLLEAVETVESVMPVQQPFKLASREVRQAPSEVRVNGVVIGGKAIVVMAGPCSVESGEQLMTTALAVKAAGANMLRGGAYKPRTSPYDFQGLGVEALRLLRDAREATGLAVVTEVMSETDVEIVAEYADMLQVGARNMQNFSLLRKLAVVPRPILLKRGPSATIKEWLLAAEYLLAGGNANVVLCERGIKTFETATRNTLDLAAVALAKELSHLPVVADPSHGTGLRSLVGPMSKAAVAAGADGLILEVHPCPERALSDGAQSLDLPGFAALMKELGREPSRDVKAA